MRTVHVTAIAATVAGALLVGAAIAETDEVQVERKERSRERAQVGDKAGRNREEAQNRNRGEGEQKRGHGELTAFRNQQEKKIEEFRETQQQENTEFFEACRGKQPVEALPEIIAHRNTQFAEMQAFMTTMHQEFLTFMGEWMTKNNIPADKQAERVAKMTEQFETRQAHHQEIHNSLIAALQALLGKEDLTWEQIREALRAAMPEREGDGQRDRPGKGHGRAKGLRDRNRNRGDDNKPQQDDPA